ncbi:hypothetical protein HBB16_20685 [Pseudonocardia sp. MCCB 268]|nr:hypothetical protein [Pseudonocardia cytotoxica]
MTLALLRPGGRRPRLSTSLCALLADALTRARSPGPATRLRRCAYIPAGGSDAVFLDITMPGWTVSSWAVSWRRWQSAGDRVRPRSRSTRRRLRPGRGRLPARAGVGADRLADALA